MHPLAMRSLFCLPALMLMVVSGSAQFQASFVAKTDLTALAYYRTTGTKSAKIPKQTNLIPGKSISVSNGAIATVSASFTQTASQSIAKIAESGTGRYTTANTTGYSRTGPHSTLLVIKSSRPTHATLRVTWSLKTTGLSGAVAGAWLDIGNNGKFDWSSASSQSRDFPVTISAQGLSIATTTSGSATASSRYRFVSYNALLTIEILPPKTCLFFQHGKACGLTMSAENRFFDRLSLAASGAKSSSLGAMILGVKRTQISLPGTSCQIYVEPLLLLPLIFDAKGTIAMESPLPNTRPFLLVAQGIGFQPRLIGSVGITVFCP